MKSAMASRIIAVLDSHNSMAGSRFEDLTSFHECRHNGSNIIQLLGLGSKGHQSTTDACAWWLGAACDQHPIQQEML